MIAAYWQLFMLTVVRPAEAARMVFARNLSAETLWIALALAAVLNILIYAVSLVLFVPSGSDMPPLFGSPVMVLAVLAAGLLIMTFGLFWAGRAIGGQAKFTDILAAVTWLQYMRLGVQLAALVLMLVLPGLADIAVFAAGIYGIYIMAHFLNEAHGFGALSKAFFLILMTAIGVALGFTLFLTALGSFAIGGT